MDIFESFLFFYMSCFSSMPSFKDIYKFLLLQMSPFHSFFFFFLIILWGICSLFPVQCCSILWSSYIYLSNTLIIYFKGWIFETKYAHVFIFANVCSWILFQLSYLKPLRILHLFRVFLLEGSFAFVVCIATIVYGTDALQILSQVCFWKYEAQVMAPLLLGVEGGP